MAAVSAARPFPLLCQHMARKEMDEQLIHNNTAMENKNLLGE